MKELSSYQIQFKHSLKTSQIMKLSKLAGNKNQDVYLHQGQLIADAGHLPKLLSFFLFMDVDQPVVLIIDGINTNETYDEINRIWKNNISEISCRRRYRESMMEHGTSITV